MVDSGREEDTVDGEAEDARPACVALVPMVQAAQWSQDGWQQGQGQQGSGQQSQGQPMSRPSSIFVTHLIATAERAPQTRKQRRASAADAQTAYSTHQRQLPRIGVRTRQVI
jgi:hypothetical protein